MKKAAIVVGCFLFLSLCAVAAEMPSGYEENWPQWRGPSRQGEVEGGGYPETWSQTENVLWKVEVPGSGNSSPIVWSDRIFLTTAYDGGKRRSILSFNRSDGKLLWEAFAPESKPEGVHAKNGHASSTAATDGERVYAYLGNSGLLAVDFAGKKVWHRPLGPFNAFHGTASSPLLYGNLVIILQDGESAAGAAIAAYDKRTGEEVWRTPRDASRGWSSPVVVSLPERDEIIVNGEFKTTAYRPETGEALWTARGNTNEPTPTPVFGHGLVFCSSGREGATLAIRPGGSGDVTDTHVVWKLPKGSSFIPSTILDGGYLYMINDVKALVICFDALTGEVMYEERLGQSRRDAFSASPVAVDGKIFITTDDGETFVLKSGPEYNLLHVNTLGEGALASPALGDGQWYFRTVKHLVAIGGER